jgi:hypothetical protein
MSFAVRRFALRLSIATVVVFAGSFVFAATETTIDLSPQVGPNDLAEVTLEMEVGGTMRVPKDRGNSPEINDLPMSVAAKLVYEEHRIAPADGKLANRAVRWYKDAGATIKVDADGKMPKLSDDRRLVVVDNPGARLVIASPHGLLEREELDLLDAVGDSLAVDGLLPTEPVANGATWTADPAVMASLLSLDNVAACEVQSVLDKFNADFALVRIAGTVVGSVDGAATEMELRGVYLVDRRLHRVTKCNLAVKEIRSVGGATPGLDSIAKLRLAVRPLASSPNLAEDVIAPLLATSKTAPSKTRVDLLWLDAASQGFRAIHDRRWFVTSRDRETTTLRRVDGADVVAHATITALPQKSLGRQTTLPEFEQDIRRSLGESFGQLVLSRQWVNAYRHHCLEIAVRGTMQEVPVEWHYYLVAPEVGPRVSISVTIEGAMVERVANADRNLVNGIQLVAANNTPSGPAASQPPAAAQSSPAQSPPVQFRTTQPAARPAAAPLVPPQAAAPAPQSRRTIEWSARAQNLDRSMIVPGR